MTKDQLRQISRTMYPHKAQEIREAYYKAIEGLQTLASALEEADALLPKRATAPCQHSTCPSYPPQIR